MAQPVRINDYSSVMKLIHWTTALIVIGLLCIGPVIASDWEMSEQFWQMLVAGHKSFGLVLLFLTVFRIAWRLTHPVPPLPLGLRPWEIAIARLVHKCFYVLLIVQPLVGWMIHSLVPNPTYFFGLFPIPDLPFVSRLGDAQTVMPNLEDMHTLFGILIAVLLFLHVGAAFKHHFMVRDDVLLRMAPAGFAPFLSQLRGGR